MITGNVLCPCCGYDLSGVPAHGDFYRCPECGELATLESLTRTRRNRRLAITSALIGGAFLVAILLFAMFKR